MAAAIMGQKSDVSQYPTEVFPRGVPPDTEMTVTPVFQLTLRPEIAPERGRAMTMDMEGFAKMIHHVFDRPGANDASSPQRLTYGFGAKALDNLTSHGAFTPGSTSAIEAVAVFPNGEKIDWFLPYSHQDADQACSFADLPKEYREALYKEWQKLEPKDPLLPKEGPAS
jgi:hypothetical protein